MLLLTVKVININKNSDIDLNKIYSQVYIVYWIFSYSDNPL